MPYYTFAGAARTSVRTIAEAEMPGVRRVGQGIGELGDGIERAKLDLGLESEFQVWETERWKLGSLEVWNLEGVLGSMLKGCPWLRLLARLYVVVRPDGVIYID